MQLSPSKAIREDSKVTERILWFISPIKVKIDLTKSLKWIVNLVFRSSRKTKFVSLKYVKLADFFYAFDIIRHTVNVFLNHKNCHHSRRWKGTWLMVERWNTPCQAQNSRLIVIGVVCLICLIASNCLIFLN